MGKLRRTLLPIDIYLTISSSVDEDDIEDQCTALRKKLELQQNGRKDTAASARGLKSHQVHELAQAKIEESEKLRRALGISKDYEEGSHWRRQEEKTKTAQRKTVEDDEDERRRKPKNEDDYSD